MHFYIETYGCSRNLADSEAIAGALSEEHTQVEKPEAADIIAVNTCIVKTPTENKVLRALKKYSQTKKRLIVAGCMPAAQLEIAKQAAPNAEFWGVKHDEVLQGPHIRANKVVGIIPISSGCLGSCNYCIVRFARGKLKSYAPEKITAAVQNSIQDGCREVWITSQDNSAYGLDINTNLAELLKKVTAILGDFKTRVGMMNPNHVLKIQDELIDSFKSEKIFKFLHLPVQSGNDEMLKSMNRHYTVAEFKNIVSAFRKEFPHLTLSTDIIVGYPGETESQFQDSVKLVKEIQPDIVNISRYGARPGTPAAKLKQHQEITKKERSRKLAKLMDEIGLKKNQAWLDWGGEVLIDEHGTRDDFMGRNFAYKPIVVKGKHELGDILNIKIKKATNSYLVAKHPELEKNH